MTDLLTVTVVCTGNLCRSPLGAVLLDKHLRARGVQHVDVRSAGTHATEGTRAMLETEKAAAALGSDLTLHRTTVLDGTLARASDLLLCAATEHRSRILDSWPDLDPARVRMFNEDLQDEELVDVEDPYGWDEEVYHMAARVIDAAMDAWAERLATGWTPDAASG